MDILWGGGDSAPADFKRGVSLLICEQTPRIKVLDFS